MRWWNPTAAPPTRWKKEIKTKMSSIYDIEVVEIIQIVNPTPRGALPVGDIAVNAVYANQALHNFGATLHRLRPFEVLDKVGFLKTGDEAAELFLDALARQ